jgi:uncharacterized protein
MSDLQPITPQPLADIDATVKSITRPSPRLLTLYMVQLFFMLPLAPFIVFPLYFRYHTLRYRFDDDGVHASWGILFRREVSLTYARIQDIHLRRHLIERWLGIGTVQIQTASGSGAAELVIEGVSEFVAVRDFLYAKMRGAVARPGARAPGAAPSPAFSDEAVRLLRDIKEDLQAVREELERDRRRAGHGAPDA